MKRNSKVIMNEMWEQGSTNVFADLEMVDAEIKLAKAGLALKINLLLKERGLKQADAAKLLGIDQSKISLLNRGRLSAFSFERLIKYLRILKQNVDIVINAPKGRKHSGVVRVV